MKKDKDFPNQGDFVYCIESFFFFGWCGLKIGTDVSLLGGSGNGKFRGLPRMRIFYCNWFKDSDFWSARCWVVRPV